jgi:hypothetical protein
MGGTEEATAPGAKSRRLLIGVGILLSLLRWPK